MKNIPDNDANDNLEHNVENKTDVFENMERNEVWKALNDTTDVKVHIQWWINEENTKHTMCTYV